jgi:hypothetical protein
VLGLEVELEEEVVDCAVEPVYERTRGAVPREWRLYQSLNPGVLCRNIRSLAYTLEGLGIPLHYDL